MVFIILFVGKPRAPLPRQHNTPFSAVNSHLQALERHIFSTACGALFVLFPPIILVFGGFLGLFGAFFALLKYSQGGCGGCGGGHMTQ